MRARLPAAALLALAAALALPGCGRVGPVRAKGPPEAIVYPRAYPYFPPAPSAAPPASPAGVGELPMERPGIMR